MRRAAALLAALLVGSTLVAAPAAAAEGTTIDHDGDAVTLAAGPDQAITGQTDLSPGANVTVRIQVDDGATPFLAQRRATVSEDGSFTVDVDLHPADPGATGNVTVLHDGRELGQTPLAVTACDGDCPEPSATTTSESPLDVDGDHLTLSAAQAQETTGQIDEPAGTSVTVRIQSSDTDSPFIRQKKTTVDENGTFAVQFDLAAAEAGSDAVATLLIDGETVAEQSVRIEDCDDSCEGPATDDETDTATAAVDDTSDRTDATTDRGGVSDAGLVGGGLAGLLALAGLAVRVLQ